MMEDFLDRLNELNWSHVVFWFSGTTFGWGSIVFYFFCDPMAEWDTSVQVAVGLMWVIISASLFWLGLQFNEKDQSIIVNTREDSSAQKSASKKSS